MRNVRSRLAILAAVVAMATAGSIAYVASQRSNAPAGAGNARSVPVEVAVTDIAALQVAPRIVFRSTALGEHYGKVAMVSLADPSGARAFTPTSCDRVYATPSMSICLVLEVAPLPGSQMNILGSDFRPQRTLPMLGLPTRARMSSDAAWSASTAFRSGDSYATPGRFSTQTMLRRSDGATSIDLENMPLYQDLRLVDAIDRNFWGVTFAAGGDTFYATAAWGGATFLVQGSISANRMDTVRQDAECPSLSPDGTKVAYKKLGDRSPGSWRLTVFDLVTGVETELAETRSVDDQVEWLDSNNILYGMPRSGVSETSITDVFTVPADGTGQPALLIPAAASPSVLR